MKWIENLEQYNISFNMHVLQKNDSIIISQILYEHEAQTIYIVDGLIQILKIFTNGETICTELLYKHNFCNKVEFHHNKKINYHYKAIATKKTIIITIPTKKLITYINQSNRIYQWHPFLIHKHNNNIVEILSHRNTKKRLIQVLLILAKQFGKLIKHSNSIIIPFCLSHYTLGTITGSQRVTINRIMSKLKKEHIINYNKQQIIIYDIIKLIQS